VPKEKDLSFQKSYESQKSLEYPEFEKDVPTDPFQGMVLDMFKFKLLVIFVARGDIQFKADSLFDIITYSISREKKTL